MFTLYNQIYPFRANSLCKYNFKHTFSNQKHRKNMDKSDKRAKKATLFETLTTECVLVH